ncbi:MAG: cellulase family glycosylhydrolase, partial [Ardenticatenaceae bacterium]|nr:cellulase family glycosylhydrolase [Ardenticatenaceae bacterium]
YSCADVDAHWSNDWPSVIAALNSLIQQGQICGDEPLSSKLYAAHYNYAAVLEDGGDGETAVFHYTSAFNIDPNRAEAVNALIRMNALPEPTAIPCLSSIPPRPDPAVTEIPDAMLFVQTQGNQLFLQGQPYKVKGVNYYPRHASWHQFLTEANLVEVAAELKLIQEAGFNTLRIFLWYEPLFTCQPEDAIPNEEAFARLDDVLQLASEHNLKVIVTLNDLPDLTFRPLYTDWARYDAQTTYIVRRYRHEPAILAWDLRNEGDLDYGARADDEARFEQQIVLDWLAYTSELVRVNDPYHLLTAGWWGDPTVTSEYVDILSFHHWHDPAELPDRINKYDISSQPILVEEIGYHSWQDAPQDQRSEEAQAALLSQAVKLIDEENVAGWLIWAAFDFVPVSGQTPSYEHCFGLWRSDLTPKPALFQIFAEN